jgi:hypothetical protein
MLIYIIPILAVGIAYYFFKHKLNWLEVVGQLIVPTLFILIFKGCAVQSRTTDTEYWSTSVSKVEYYESWDEWISQTCSSTCCCDEDGNNCTTTYYDCSYRRYHDEYWQMVDKSGNSYRISKSEYDRLVKKFGNKNFVDLGRDYDLNDGDKYVATWDGSNEDLEVCVTKHTYENRPQVSSSVFNYPEVSEEDVKSYGLYEYPTIYKYQKQDHLLGMANKHTEHELDVLNARLGPKKQVKLFVLVFRDKTKRSAEMQEWYWKGGNKNEFIVCIGLDKEDNVQWCYPFSWTEAQNTKINTRTFIEEQEKIDWDKTTDFLYTEMETNFSRKEFTDFDYLTVELSSGQLLALWIITFILCTILTLVFITNDFDSDDTMNGNNRHRRRGLSIHERLKYLNRRNYGNGYSRNMRSKRRW